MKGIIYKIQLGGSIYIGSTTQPLCRRQNNHNSKLTEGKRKNKLYEKARELDVKKLVCEWVEDFDCEIKDDLRRREAELIKDLNADLNAISFIGESEEAKEKRLTRSREYMTKYNEEHKEENRQKAAEYVRNNKEKVLLKKAEYRENNRDYLKEKAKEYYHVNREKISTKRKEAAPVTCECGLSISIRKKSRHEQSKRHNQLMADKLV